MIDAKYRVVTHTLKQTGDWWPPTACMLQEPKSTRQPQSNRPFLPSSVTSTGIVTSSTNDSSMCSLSHDYALPLMVIDCWPMRQKGLPITNPVMRIEYNKQQRCCRSEARTHDQTIKVDIGQSGSLWKNKGSWTQCGWSYSTHTI